MPLNFQEKFSVRFASRKYRENDWKRRFWCSESGQFWFFMLLRPHHPLENLHFWLTFRPFQSLFSNFRRRFSNFQSHFLPQTDHFQGSNWSLSRVKLITFKGQIDHFQGSNWPLSGLHLPRTVAKLRFFTPATPSWPVQNRCCRGCQIAKRGVKPPF